MLVSTAATVSCLPGLSHSLIVFELVPAPHDAEGEWDQFREFFEQNDEALLIFELARCAVIDANRSAWQLFGYSHDELIEGGVGLFCQPAELDNLKRLICGPPIAQPYVMTYMRRDRTKSILSFRSNIISLKQGPLVYCSFKDIGEKIRLKEEIRFRQAQLIHANKMGALGMLVSSVAHEVNNPNNFILHNIEIISEAFKDVYPILQDYYQENGDYYLGGIPLSEFEDIVPRLIYGIRDGSERIRNIVENLRDFVRSDRARLDGIVDMGVVVGNAVALMRSEISKHTNSFSVECADNVPLVRGSAQKLEQVVINLLLNALQALTDRHQAVTVGVAAPAGTGEVKITIADEGVGMDEPVKIRLLEPFFSTKLDQGGTGLGLYISHSIVREHHGNIAFSSELARGTAVTVSLPAISKKGFR